MSPQGLVGVWEGPTQMDKETEFELDTERLTQCKDKDAEAGRRQDCPRHPGLSFEPGPPDPSTPLQTGSLRSQGKLGSWNSYLLELLD